MKDIILKFLQSKQIMTLASISEDNTPHCSVVLYVVDDNFNIYFITNKYTQKAKNILANNNVAISIWEHKILSLQMSGTAEIVNDKKQFEDYSDKIAEASVKEGGDFLPPVIRINLEPELIMFKIKINSIKHLDLKSTKIKESTYPVLTLEINK